MELQQCRWPNDHRHLSDAASLKEERPQAEDESILGRQIWSALSRPANDHQLLFEHQALGDNCSGAAGADQLSEQG